MGFAIFAITTLTIIYGLVGLRIIQPAKVGIIWKIFLWAVLLVFYTAIILTIIFRFKFPHSPVTIPLSWFGFVSFGFVTLTFPFILFRDIVFIICKGAWGLVAWVHGIVSPARTRGLANPSRRQFLVNTSNIAVLGVTGSLTGYGLAEARRIPEVVAVKVPLENLPPAFEGFKILQITDLHIGMTIRRDYVQAVVEKANDLDPDIIVMTGDLADGSAMDLGGEATPLADLQASFGKFFVTGNHEYYSGVGPWLTKVTQWGFIPLMNTHRIIRHRGSMIVLAGVTDYRASRIVPQHASDPEAALAGVPENMVKIMLAHQPKSVYKAETAGADLLICGHTHGGQYFPWNYMVSLDQPYVYGLHWHGKTQVYVSRGTGYWGPPIRIGAPSEITLLRIVRKQG